MVNAAKAVDIALDSWSWQMEIFPNNRVIKRFLGGFSMKKIIPLIAIFLSSAMLVSCVVNTQDNTDRKDNAESTQQNSAETTTEVLSSQNVSNIDSMLADEINAAALVFFGDTPYGYVVTFYGGEVEGCHICQVTAAGDTEIIEWAHRSVEIEKYFIEYPNSKLYYAYKDGKFYTVKEAYDQGILSMDGVIEFAKRTAYKHGYDLYPVD